jgi:flagellar hook-basal body complex protein FliE
MKVESGQPLSLPRIENGKPMDAAPGPDFKKFLSNSLQEVNKLQSEANQ